MNTPNLHFYQAEYERKLLHYSPVEDIYQAELAQELLGADRFDTDFHHFMHDFVGNISNSAQIPLIVKNHNEIGELNYSNRMFVGFSDSAKILVVRCSSDVPMDKPEHFFMATADLRTGDVSSWAVSELLARDTSGFECYMENESGDEAHLVLGSQKIRLAMAGERRPEPLTLLDEGFFNLLEYRRRLQIAPGIGRLMMFMYDPSSVRSEETPVTIAA
jgi:hypothetical protein